MTSYDWKINTNLPYWDLKKTKILQLPSISFLAFVFENTSSKTFFPNIYFDSETISNYIFDQN